MRDGTPGTALFIALVVIAALWCVGIDAPWIGH